MPSRSSFESNEEYNAWFRKWRKGNLAHRIYNRLFLRKWRAEHGTVKDRIRDAVLKAVKRGELKKCPCEICGSVIVEAHHSDYSKPMCVRWLCRIHHRQVDVAEGKRKN
jgi:hypothetical protein